LFLRGGITSSSHNHQPEGLALALNKLIGSVRSYSSAQLSMSDFDTL